MTNNNQTGLKKKGYPYYLLNIVLFIALIIAADFIAGRVLKYFYFHQASGWDYETKYSVEDTKADVLIFGASRAQQQYIPTFIEDSLHLSCYNVGRDGMPFFYHYAVLQAVLKRYTPKMILLDCEYGTLKKTESSYERLSCLLPFYKNHPEMRSVIELRSPFEKYKLLSQTYPYNSLIFKILSGNLESGKKKNVTIKGYLALTRSLDEPMRPVNFTEKYELDTVKVNMLRSFINDCKERNIPLYLVVSPYYINPIGNDYSDTITRQIASSNKVDFLDYSKREIFTSNSKLFDDTVHVNTTGAKIFSAMLAGDLKQKLITKK